MSDYKRLKPHKVKINNPKYEWLEKNYPGFLHTIFMQGIQAGVYESNKLYSFAFKAGYSWNFSNAKGELEIDWFWDARELDRVRNIFLNKAKKNLDFFTKIYRRWENDHYLNLAAYPQAEKIDYQKLTDRELYDIYEKLYRLNIRQGATGYLADCFLSSGEQDWLTHFIRQQVGAKHDLSELVSILTQPVMPSYTNEEEIALVKIGKQLNFKAKSYPEFLKKLKSRPKIWQDLENHARKFYWIENNYFDNQVNIEYFAKKLFELWRGDFKRDTVRHLEQNRKNKSRLLKKINDPWLANIVAMTELFTHMQDYRKMVFIRLSHFFKLIFSEMAKRTDLALEDYYNLVEPEFAAVFLKRKIDRQMLKERRVKSFCYGTAKGYAVYQGKDLNRFISQSDFMPPAPRVSEIKGVPASPGKVRGRIRIVKNAHTSEFKQGEILVTNNTTPEFVPLMKKALAIITEQGGITTHAAIVSRELGVPCVIGTKIATKVLKDGDLVEVDAVKGLIRKIQ